MKRKGKTANERFVDALFEETDEQREVREVDYRVKSWIGTSANDELVEKLKDRRVGEFPELEFSDYWELQTAIEEKKVDIYPSPILEYEKALLRLVGTQNSIWTYNRTKVFWPVFVFVGLIGCSIIFQDWWLLLGIPFFFVAQLTSTKGNRLGALIYTVCLGSIIYCLFTGRYHQVVLPLSFIVMHNAMSIFRQNYREALVYAAKHSESALLLLLWMKCITMYRLDEQQPRKLKMN